MPLTTYTTLQAAVKNWLKEPAVTGVSGSVDMVPDFISIGEEELFRRLRVRAMEATGTLATVAGAATVALPNASTFRAFKSLRISGYGALSFMPEEQMADKFDGQGSGIPSVYCPVGDNLVLGRTPGAVYSLPYTAYFAPTPLSGSTATNTLFPRFGSLYLYASLKAGFGLLEDDAQVKKYEALLKQGIDDAHREDLMDRHGGSTVRTRPDIQVP